MRLAQKASPLSPGPTAGPWWSIFRCSIPASAPVSPREAASVRPEGRTDLQHGPLRNSAPSPLASALSERRRDRQRFQVASAGSSAAVAPVHAKISASAVSRWPSITAWLRSWRAPFVRASLDTSRPIRTGVTLKGAHRPKPCECIWRTRLLGGFEWNHQASSP